MGRILSLAASEWLDNVAPGTGGDVNDDGIVNGQDISLMASHWLETAPLLTPPTAVEGVAFTNSTVYRFTDDNTLATASDYSAVVTLGDGNTVTLTSAAGPNGQIVADPNGGFDVQLSYTYREELSNATFGVAVTDQGGQTTGGGTSNFSVADAALHGGSRPTPPTAGRGRGIH